MQIGQAFFYPVENSASCLIRSRWCIGAQVNTEFLWQLY